MTTTRLITVLATSLVLTAAALPARATNNAEAGYDLTMAKMDADKDGMVSKKEFLDTMARVWDMKAKKMAMKGDKMAFDAFEREIMMYLKAGA